MIKWNEKDQEQFDSLMEDHKLVIAKIKFLEKEQYTQIEEMSRIYRELQLLYRRAIQ